MSTKIFWIPLLCHFLEEKTQNKQFSLQFTRMAKLTEDQKFIARTNFWMIF